MKRNFILFALLIVFLIALVYIGKPIVLSMFGIQFEDDSPEQNSGNYVGYMAMLNTHREKTMQIDGQWTVTSVDCSSLGKKANEQNGATAQWIGYDQNGGGTNYKLVQIVTGSICDNGKKKFVAAYQEYPDQQSGILFTNKDRQIKVNDKIHSWIIWHITTGVFDLWMHNGTQGWFYHKSISVPVSTVFNRADWIVESADFSDGSMQLLGRAPLLIKFPEIQFHGCQINGKDLQDTNGIIRQTLVDANDMSLVSKPVIATASPLKNGQFTVSYVKK